MKTEEDKLGFEKTIIEDDPDNIQSIEFLRKPILSKHDLEYIEVETNKATGNIEKSLSQKDIENEGLIIPMLSTTFLIVFIIFITRISIIYDVSQATINLINPASNSITISSLDDLDIYVRDQVLSSLLNKPESLPYFNVAGIKFTLRVAKMTKQPYSRYSQVEFIRAPYDYSVATTVLQEFTNRLGIWFYGKNKYDGLNGYSEYFINCDITEALDKWRTMKPLWLDNKSFISLTIEIIIQNPNSYTTLYYFKNIVRQSTGKFTFIESSNGVSPELYSSQPPEFVSIIVIFSFLIVVLFIQFAKFLRRFQEFIKRLITKLENSLNVYDYLEILLVVCEISTVALFVKADLLNMGKYSLPLTTKDFDLLIAYANNYRDLVRIASLCCLFSVLRLVALMKIQFPSFGVLFETINLTKDVVVNICFIAAILYCGFILAAHILYGMEEVRFSNLLNTSLDFFKLLIGNITALYVVDSSSSLLVFLTFLYIFLFYFVIIKLFSAVIIGTFIMIKDRDRLLIAAKTLILREKSKQFIQILFKFLDLNKTKEIYKDVKEYEKLNRQSFNENVDNREKMLNIENFIKNQYNTTFMQRIKSNLSTLKTFLHESNLINQNIYIENLKIKIKEILTKEKVEEKAYQLRELDVEFNFKLIRGLVCYSFMVIFFMVSSFLFLDIRTSWEVSQVNINYVNSIKIYERENLKLSQVLTVDEIYLFTERLVYSLLNEPYESINFLDTNKTIRLTIKQYSTYPNKSKFSEKAVSYVVDSADNVTDFRGPQTKVFYSPYPSGSLETYQRLGGLSYEISEVTNAQELSYLLTRDDLYRNCKFIALEWVTYSINSDHQTYNTLVFDIGVQELVSYSLESTSINPNFYSASDNKIRGLLIVAIMMYVYFMVVIIIDIVVLWRKMNAKRLKKLRKSRHYEKIIQQICEVSSTDIHSYTTSFFSLKLKHCLESIYSHIIQILTAVYTHFTRDPFNIIETSTLCLAFGVSGTLLKISSNPLELNNLNDFSEAKNFLYFLKGFIAVTSLILLLQSPRYLQIFPRISHFVRDYLNAGLDIIFFCMMFFIVLIGYVFAGYILLGHYHPGFYDLPHSFFSCLFLQWGIIDQQEFYNADNVLGIFYVFLYVVIIIFFLTTMFTAIVAGYYTKNKPKPRMSLLEKIAKTVKAKLAGVKVIQLSQAGEETMSQTNILDKVIITIKDSDFSIDNSIQKDFMDGYSYMTALEKKLCNYKISLSNQALDIKETLEYCDLHEVLYLNVDIWKEEPMKNKIKIWNTLSSHYRNEILCRNGGSFNILSDNEIKNCSALQVKLWESLSQDEMVEMWTGKVSEEGRSDIWNIEQFPDYLKDCWENMGVKEKIESCKKFLSSDTLKSTLWKSLKSNYLAKLKYMLNLREKLDYEVVMHLIILESINNPIFIQLCDYELENVFDVKVFSCFFQSSVCQEEINRFNYLKTKKKDSKADCSTLRDYYIHAKTQVQLKKIELKNLQKKLKKKRLD